MYQAAWAVTHISTQQKETLSMYSRIVVGTDGTDRSLIAVNHAAKLAAAVGAELHIVAAATPDEPGGGTGSTMTMAIARLSDRAAKTAAKIGHDVSKRHGVRVVEHPQVGEAASVLLAVSESIGADLIVVGNKGANRRSHQSTGSVANRLSRQATCPVLTVHTG
jgi:nucleotide-binding universal stress UspA family protein